MAELLDPSRRWSETRTWSANRRFFMLSFIVILPRRAVTGEARERRAHHALVKNGVSRLERGANLPPLDRLQGVATALGVELHDLLRFGPPGRHHERDLAMDRLVAMLAGRGADEIDLVADLAAAVFKKR